MYQGGGRSCSRAPPPAGFYSWSDRLPRLGNPIPPRGRSNDLVSARTKTIVVSSGLRRRFDRAKPRRIRPDPGAGCAEKGRCETNYRTRTFRRVCGGMPVGIGSSPHTGPSNAICRTDVLSTSSNHHRQIVSQYIPGRGLVDCCLCRTQLLLQTETSGPWETHHHLR